MLSTIFPTLLAHNSFLSSIFVPVIGWVVPIVTFSFLFLYLEREDIA